MLELPDRKVMITMVESLVVKVNSMQDEMSNRNRDKETLRKIERKC